MPVLDSFLIDHTKIKSPSLRKSKVIVTPKKDKITIFDFRFCLPNVEIMPSKGIHTLEHLFSEFMRSYIDLDDSFSMRKVVDISPMGCKTGFYMIIIGDFIYKDCKIIVDYWRKSMLDILNFNKDVFGANIYQCGSYKFHSLSEAKKIASNILSKKIIILNNNDLYLNLSLIS